MAYEKNDFNSAIETIKAARIKQRAFTFWLDYRDLRKDMDTLIKTGRAFCCNRTVWRNMNAQYGQGKFAYLAALLRRMYLAQQKL